MLSHRLNCFILTKCDAIEGFREFAGELDSDELEQIFGWSNPHGRELEFDPAWVDEAVDSMRITLERVQSRLFALHEYNEQRGAMYLFPGNLYALTSALRLLLARVLRSGSDIPTPLFRGLYCSGSVRGVEWQNISSTQLVPVSILADSRAADAFATSSTLSWMPKMMEPWLRSGLQIAFIHDLFVKRIFRERGLAVPLTHRLALATARV
jgi:type VI secretion system protein ImpL